MVPGPRIVLGWVVAALLAAPVRAERPADAILRLAPPDAAITLVVEDLNGQAETILKSPLWAQGLAGLPAARDWFVSDDFRRLDMARRGIEAALGTDLATLRVGLVGDALVLTMTVPPDAGPESAQGLLLLKPRDVALLERTIAAVNQADRDDLRALVSKSWRGSRYHGRRFRDGIKPDEWYVLLEGPVFAWSNSEDLVRGVIASHRAGRVDDRLMAAPSFQRLREGLPAQALASLFIEPRTLERLVREDRRPRDEAQARVARAVLDFLGAVEHVGLAVEWRDGPILHVRQVLDPQRVPESWRAWSQRPGSAEGLLSQVPSSALGLMVGHIHPPPLIDLLRLVLDPKDWSQLERLAEAVRALPIGPGGLTDVPARLGPGMVGYLEAPAPDSAGWSWLLASQLEGGDGKDDPDLARRVDAALRSALAFLLLQAPEDRKTLRLVDRTMSGCSVTTLTGDLSPAYSVQTDRVVLGSTPATLARFLTGERGGGPPDLARHRAAYFAGPQSFAYLDLDRLRAAIADRRPGVESWLASRKVSARELDEALDLLTHFRFGFATARMGPDLDWMHHTVGLVAEGPKAQP